MKKSKLSILLLFLVMILAISAVSAADTNDTSDSDLQAVDEAPVDEVASDVDKLSSTDSDDVLSTGGGTFTDLQTLVNNSGTTPFTLNSNYTRVGNEEAIVIEGTTIIVGNGYTIDGNNNGGIFKVNQGGTLILQNVILINGNSENGGAIYNDGSVMISQNSQFYNNNATIGGAIYNNAFLDIAGSTFINGSVYNNGDLTLSGNTFDAPIVTTATGVINSDIKVTVLDNNVKKVKGEDVTLTAIITDDNGNVINQIGNLFKFTVDDVEVGAAAYNDQLKKYQLLYTLTQPGIYNVSVNYAPGNNKLIITSKEKNLINYRGTYTDLQVMINATTTTLGLPYDITYNEVVDANNFNAGVVIDKAITINGNGHTISGNNAYRIFDITAGNVVLTNVTLTKGNATYGGAIYVDNGGNLTTNAIFTNNNADNGADIYTNGNLIVNQAKFDDDNAVYIGTSGIAEISNSLFTSAELYAINNYGTLALADNTVKAIFNYGTITSTVKALVLDDSNTVFVESPNVKLYANITDDNNNPISQGGFKFIINNQNVDAKFNETTLLYEAVYTLPSFGYYDVNLTGTATDIINGTITYITGTFTDLQRLINNTQDGKTLELPYDFTYDLAFDGTNFPNGVVIDKAITIDGKGHTINGSNSNSIFNVTASTTLNNITFANADGAKFGAVYATADLTVTNSAFIDNAAESGAGILVSDENGAVVLTVNACNFTGGVVENGGGAICIDASSGNGVEYSINGSEFTNNAAQGGIAPDYCAAGGAIFMDGNAVGTITNDVFTGNKADSTVLPNGGAIKVQFGAEAIIDKCTFEANTAVSNAGGAISVQAKNGRDCNVAITNSLFKNNKALGGAAVAVLQNNGKSTASIENCTFEGNEAQAGDIYLDEASTASISGSNFTSQSAAIYNWGNIILNKNSINTVILNKGNITSQFTAIVLDNKTYETKDANYTLNATLTDDNGNLIHDINLKFVVNGQTIAAEPTYDETTGVYTYADYPITMDDGKYVVSVSLASAPSLVVKTGTIKNLRVGTFTDLKAKLDNATDTLELPYDFAYNEELDGDLKVIVLNKTIDGKGHTISGNGIADGFIVNADVAIKNTVFADVKSFAIKNNATITLTNNTISKDKALIINNGTISSAVVNVMDGKTLEIKFNQKVTLNATFTDDKGNLIEDARFAFSVTNVAAPIKATYNNGLYTAEYTADKVETKTVDVANIGIVAQTKATLKIAKAKVVITIVANDTIERKQNESINVTLKDEFGNVLKGEKITVFIKNSADDDVESYENVATDANGQWLVEIPGLAIDNYTILVNFAGTENFIANSKIATFKVVELNITNTFTELQRLIQANEGTENVLVLPHNFKYNDYVDEDFYAEGVLISKNITIDGNGTTIDADNVYRILNIADGATVTIKNVTFINGNSSVGAAILTNADSLTIDSCNFINGTATDGGAIYINGTNVMVTGETLFKDNTADMGGAIFDAIGSNLTVIGAVFDNNTAVRAGAVFVGEGAILTLTGSKFTNNVDNYNTAIGNFGTLALDSNAVDNTIYNNGTITTPVYSTVLENETYQIIHSSGQLTADLLDESGNKILDPEFRFVVNGKTVEVKPDYNATTGIYNITYAVDPSIPAYIIDVASANLDNLVTKTSTLKNFTGTFTELQFLIKNATGTLELPYDFAYVASVDGENFPEGVLINKTIAIDGKGHTISGSNSNRIFLITAATTLNNISLVEGNATEFGGAILTTANLNVYDSVFDQNAVSQNDANGGAIMVLAATADLTLNIKNVNFTNNKVDNAGGAIAVAGVSSHDVTYNIYDSLFENNVAITNGTGNAAGAAIFSYGDTVGLINNTIFRGNKAETGDVANGGAIKIQFGGTLRVANSTFDNNVANRTGGAISIQAYNDQTRLVVEKCTFTNNNAYRGSAIGSAGNYDSTYVTITDSSFNEHRAVYLDEHTTARISNSKFTSADVYAIYNLGSLALSGNTVNVIFNNGTITSQVNSTVLDNKTYDIVTADYYINASLVDDNNNKIYDPNLRFVINGQTNDTVPYYDATNGVYMFILNTTADERIYVVDTASANEKNLNTKTSIVREIIGTFTDLQKQINKATGDLNLQYDFTYTPEVDDGSFDEGILINNAITIDGKGYAIIGNNNKRIFNVTAKNVELENITLVNGSAANGGAIYVADGADLTVNAAVFENNSAEIGSDIYVADNAKLTVTKTTFNDDSAVYVAKLANASIATSKFTSEEVYAIYNLGSLALSGNTVRVIFNNGTITSKVTATFIGGQTIAAELADEVTPNATLTDDNGNPIYDARLIITVRGNALETAYDVSTNLYTAKYTIANAGENVVSANYTATLIEGIYDVPKANVTEFTVEILPPEVPYGENATVNIVLLGTDGEQLSATGMTVVINNTEYYVDIVKGAGSFNVSGLAPGNYAALAIFNGNENYNGAYATAVFDVLEQDIILSVEVENIEFKDTAVVNITLTFANGTPAVGKVSVVVDGVEVIVSVDGNKSVGFEELAVGKYNVTATLLPDGLYDEVVNDTESFEVFDRHEVIVPASANETITYGEDLTVEIGQIISMGTGVTITGNATISIYDGPDSTVTPVMTISGINITEEGATVDGIAGLNVGSYMIIVDFDSTDGYYAGQATAYTTVTKAKVGRFIITTIDAVYGNQAPINITIKGANEENLNGTLSIALNGEIYVLNDTITDGNYVTYVPADYDVGTYTVEVSFEEANGNYETDSASETVAITKATPTLVINDSVSFVYGENIEIPFTLTGVDGKGINGTVLAIRAIAEFGAVIYDEATGEGTISFNVLPVGEQLIVVKFLSENGNYVNTEKEVNLTITEAEINISSEVITVDPVFGDNVNFTITVEGLVGDDKVLVNVTLFKDGKYYFSDEFETGSEGTYVFEGLDAGEYHYDVVHVGGDDNYQYNATSVSFTVAPKKINESDVEVQISGVAPEDALVYIEGPASVYNVTVDGQTVQVNVVYDDDVGYAYGMANITGLTTGNKTATIAIDNENYALEPFTYDFAYFKDPEFTVTISGTYPNAQIIILGSAGNYTIEIDGFDPIDVEVSPFGLIGLATIENINAGEYIALVSYNANDEYSADSEYVTFTVDKANATVSVVVDDIVEGENAIVYITATSDDVDSVNATVKLILDGVSTDVKVVNGSAVVPIAGVPQGSHNIIAVIADNNYNYNSDSYGFYVKYATELNVYTDEDEYVYGDTVTITVTLNATSLSEVFTVSLTVGEESYNVVVENGVGVLQIEDLYVGEYNITSYFPGDNVNNYTEGKLVTFVVTPKELNESDVSVFIEGDAPNDVVVSIEGPDSVYNVTVDGQTVQVFVMDGEGTATISGLTIGNKTATIAIDDDNYELAPITKEFAYFKYANLTAKVEQSGIKYEENATVIISIDADANGTIEVYDDGEFWYAFSVEEARQGIEIPLLTVGTHLIRFDYSGDGVFAPDYDYVIVSVEAIAPAIEVNVTENAKVGDKVTLDVSVNVNEDGNVSILVDGIEIFRGETDLGGLASADVFDLAAGEHNYIVIFEGTDNYLSNQVNGTFTVSKIDPTISIIVDKYEIGVLGSPVVNVTVAPDATGRIIVDLNGEQLIADSLSDKGDWSYQIVDLVAGEYYINVTYDGDGKYNAAEKYISFVVPKSATIPQINGITNITYGEELKFTVTMDNDFAKGNVTIFVNGKEFGTFELDDYASANISIPDLVPQFYSIGVKYNGDDNFNESVTVSANAIVYKADSAVNVVDTIADLAYGNDVVVNYTVENRTVISVKIFNATSSVELEGIDYEILEDSVVVHDLVPGQYMIVVINNASALYESSFDFVNFNVVKATPEITIIVETAYYTSDVNVTFVVEPSTVDFVISVLNQTFDGVKFINTGNTIILNNLTTGYYAVFITTVENQNYTVGFGSESFYVSIMDVNAPENSSDTVFSLDLPSDATGYLLVDINGEHYYAPVENGTASIPVPQLVPGNYSANVTYTGDDKYPGFSTTKNITVESNIPENALSIPDSAKSDAPTTYSISLPSDATGYLEVDVDGTKYAAPLNNGTASVTIPALSEGNHNVTVKYTGDAKYTPAVKATTLNVTAPVFKLTKNKNVAAVYSAKATYKVLVLREGKAVGAGEKVTIKFNGKTYTATTDKKGYATLKLNTKVKVKKYTITATYKGVTVKNTVTIKHVIKAKNAKIKKSKKVNKIKVKTKKVNGKYLKGKKLTLKIKGKKVKAKINKKGKATFKLKKKVTKKLKAGKKYKYTVSYGKDKVTKKIKVKK